MGKVVKGDAEHGPCGKYNLGTDMLITELGYLRVRRARALFVVVRGSGNTHVTVSSSALRWWVSCSESVADSFPGKEPGMTPVSTNVASARLNKGSAIAVKCCDNGNLILVAGASGTYLANA